MDYNILRLIRLKERKSSHLTCSCIAGYSWHDIAQCVRWMSAFAYALRERSPLQPKSFHGIQPDDAHHLQTHAVDLDLLGRAQDRLHALASGGLRESPDPASQSQLPMGLDNTPQEEEGDLMFPKGMAPGIAQQAPHPALLSPPLDSDIW